MKILVIENDKNSADQLIQMLNDCYDEVSIYGPLSNIAEIRCFFQEEVTIDIILSDIKLDDGLSFDALVDMPNNTSVIFTTTHDEYAIKAFNYNCIAYLLKPIKRDELMISIDKYKRMLSYIKEMAGIYHQVHNKEIYRQRFLVVEKDGYISIPASEVSYISSELGIVHLFLKNNKRYMIDMSLEEIYSQLDPSCFFRATRQHIVNISSVARLTNWFNRKMKIILSEYPKTEIVISKEKVTRIKKWLDQ